MKTNKKIKKLLANGGGVSLPIPVKWLYQLGYEAEKGEEIEIVKEKDCIKIKKVVENGMFQNGMSHTNHQRLQSWS